MTKKNVLIGFIGQGWIGKHYADDFEKRGYEVVRYALEKPYVQNKEKIKDCDLVFIAVPTPTTPKGFDISIVKKSLNLVGKQKIAIIKSTILPGTTEKLQKEFPNIFIMHSPEFLREASAAYDAANPQRNIIGIPIDSVKYRNNAEKVLKVLPRAPYKKITKARNAELVKYAGNIFLYWKVIFANILHDLSKELEAEWEEVKEALSADPRIGESHLNPIHQSGRGAGGHCFIKDFAAFRKLHNQYFQNNISSNVLEALEKKNIDLLLQTEKDLDLLQGVYGEEIMKNRF